MFAMSFGKSLKSHVEALHVLREHTVIVASYLTNNQQTKNRNRRLAVLRTIQDLQKTHDIKLAPEDAIYLLDVPLLPLNNKEHPLHRKHFFDRFRHLSPSERSAEAKALLGMDESWTAKTDCIKIEQIRKYIKSGFFPKDLELEDVVHVASRELATFA